MDHSDEALLSELADAVGPLPDSAVDRARALFPFRPAARGTDANDHEPADGRAGERAATGEE